MLFLLSIVLLITAVYYRFLRALPKALPKPLPKPLFQFTATPDWLGLGAAAAVARATRRKELEQRNDEESKVELAQMTAEDEHDAARAARHFPSYITNYSKSVDPKQCLVMVRKEPSEKTWEIYERKNAAAKIGAWIWLHTAIPYDNNNIRVMYSICRVDTPERWERHTYFHLSNENVEISKHYSPHVTYDAMARTERKSFISCTIPKSEQNIPYRTKTVGELRDFMRLHADATIGSLIPFFEGTLQNNHGIRVIYAIYRVDKPERWEEHTYMFRLNERVPHHSI